MIAKPSKVHLLLYNLLFENIKIPSKFPNIGNTIFTKMTAMANEYGAINLAQGFPSFNPPAELIEAVNHYASNGYNQYAPMAGYKPLRKNICELVNNLYTANYKADTDICITPGATVALFCAIMAVVGENDEVIIIEPAYDSYVPAIKMAGGRCLFSQINLETMEVDWDHVKKLISYKTRAIIINTPHNPTGSILNAQDLQELEKLVSKHDIVVISDEVYEHMVFDGVEHQSVARFPKLANQSLIISSFGKTYNATGWKMGYAIGPEYLMNEFKKIYQYVAFAANTPVQMALSDYVLNMPWYGQLNTSLESKRNLISKALKNSKFKQLECKGSYFLTLNYAKISNQDSLSMATKLTQETGVALIPFSSFYNKPFAETYLRLCFAKDDDLLINAAQKLCEL